ncbi:hypothetical protein AKJ16_DCAP12206 [Drosera capensis]
MKCGDLMKSTAMQHDESEVAKHDVKNQIVVCYELKDGCGRLCACPWKRVVFPSGISVNQVEFRISMTRGREGVEKLKL